MKTPDNIGDEKARSQITLKVRLADFLARMVPEAKLEVKINPGVTVAEFMVVLTERFGAEFRRAVVDRNGKLHADIAVILNNRFIPPQQMTEHTIHETSQLSIIPIAGGG